MRPFGEPCSDVGQKGTVPFRTLAVLGILRGSEASPDQQQQQHAASRMTQQGTAESQRRKVDALQACSFRCMNFEPLGHVSKCPRNARHLPQLRAKHSHFPISGMQHLSASNGLRRPELPCDSSQTSVYHDWRLADDYRMCRTRTVHCNCHTCTIVTRVRLLSCHHTSSAIELAAGARWLTCTAEARGKYK